MDQYGGRGGPGPWMLLCYRVPREPSAPRIAIWRKLKRLGVGQLGDGLVGLPADARTREQLEWVAEEVTEAGGSAGVWLARPASLAQERELAAAMAGPPATLAAAAALVPAVNRFFEDVLVMAPDEAVRANRLTLVANVAASLRTLADFGQLPG